MDQVQIVSNNISGLPITNELIMESIIRAFEINHSSPSEAVKQIQQKLQETNKFHKYSILVSMRERDRDFNSDFPSQYDHSLAHA